MNKYRVESGSVYEYNEKERAYFFLLKLNGRSLKAALNDYERMLDAQIEV